MVRSGRVSVARRAPSATSGLAANDRGAGLGDERGASRASGSYASAGSCSGTAAACFTPAAATMRFGACDRVEHHPMSRRRDRRELRVGLHGVRRIGRQLRRAHAEHHGRDPHGHGAPEQRARHQQLRRARRRGRPLRRSAERRTPQRSRSRRDLARIFARAAAPGRRSAPCGATPWWWVIVPSSYFSWLLPEPRHRVFELFARNAQSWSKPC